MIIKHCWTFVPHFLQSVKMTRHGLSLNRVDLFHWIYGTVYVVGLSNSHEGNVGGSVADGLGSPSDGNYTCGLVVNPACCFRPGSRFTRLLLSGPRWFFPPAGFSLSSLTAHLTLVSRLLASASARGKPGQILPATSSVINPPKLALINTRSLENKTFLLNDFFLLP